MRQFYYFTQLLFAMSLVLGACKKKDEHDHEHTHEAITKVVVRFTAGSQNVTMTWEDPDGIGGLPPTIQNGTLKPATTYDIDISLAGKDGKDLTGEIIEDADFHQVYYGFSSTLFSSFEYKDQDKKGRPLGLKARVTTINSTGGGNLQLILVHEPAKSQNLPATPWVYNQNIGGEQDFNITFNVQVRP